MQMTFHDRDAIEHAPNSQTSKILATVVIANALEFFDYFSYATFAKFINLAYFPASMHSTGSLFSLGIFAAGFLARPVGAFLIGTYADTTGRKPALLLTSALITAGTLGIAVVPGHDVLGALAPVLILLCRVLQGIAIGGEMGSSGALLLESCPPARRVLYAGWLMAGQGMALVLAGACGIGIFHFLPPEKIEQWGWRLPFALASMLVPVQIYLRRHIRETWLPSSGTSPFREVASRHSRQWLIAVVLIFGGTVPTYVATYTATFGVAGAHPSAYSTFETTMAMGLAVLVFSIAGGWLADRLGSINVIMFSRISTMASVLPCFHFATSSHDARIFLCAIAWLAGISALGSGPSIIVILRMFPARGRAIAMSLVYAIGVALFGGTAPLIVASLELEAGKHFAAAWYVFFSSATTVLAISLTAKRVLENRR
jgi:MFS family permease